MLNAIKTFRNDESGAVTVDWIVLTAALVGLGFAVLGVVSSRMQDVSTDIQTGQTSSGPVGENGGVLLP